MATMKEVIENIVTPNYLKMIWDNCIQNNPFLYVLGSKGGIKVINGGEDMRWPVKGGHFTVFNSTNYGDATENNVPVQRFIRPVLAPGAKSTITPLSSDDLQMANAEFTQHDLEEDMIPDMFRDFMYSADNSVAFDGINDNSTGVARPLFGLQVLNSFSSNGTRAGTVASGAEYAGYSLEEGVVGATLNDGEDDVWSPKAADTNASVWGDAANTSGFTLNTVVSIMDYLQLELTYSSRDEKEQPDCCICTKADFLVLRDYLNSIASIRINDKPMKTDQKFGIGVNSTMLYWNGLDVYWDFDAASSMMLNFDKIRLHGWKTDKDSIDIPQSKFVKGGDKFGLPVRLVIDYDITRSSYVVRLDSMLQYCFSPRHQGFLI